ncbi:MBL fold metallo-hydrolase [Aureimonas sp. ME7]|uniref:MBL fold metallo-hydrolase n=1 Tax=Aureimonas sp. ME7 TaxID=2744252 RepID=UPI0032AF8EBB
MVELIAPTGTTRIVIDCGPDFRQQMLSAGVDRIDGIVITHPHADHIHGLDDVRSYTLDQRSLIDLYADAATHKRLLEAFGYCFQTPTGSSYPPIVQHCEITAGRLFSISGPGGEIELLPYTQVHGAITSNGFRIGPFAYSSDVSDLPADAQTAISGAGCLVIDALQYNPHPSHFSLDEAVGWIHRLGVPKAYLTHMHTPLDYGTLCSTLPPNIQPAYDGLTIEYAV